mgnify:FL=1
MREFKIYFLLFMTYSFIGWIIEIIDRFKVNKRIVNRGFLIGPYVPIYGCCAILMILLLRSVKSPITMFAYCILIASTGEYLTSYIMEKVFHARWWDYSDYKYNLNGRICLINCLGFGILGFILIKYLNNFLYNIYSNLNMTTLNIIFYTLITIFTIDLIVSFIVIFKVKKMSLKFRNPDNTNEITKKVHEILKNNPLMKRLFMAFPNVKLIIKKGASTIKNTTLRLIMWKNN